MKVRREENPVEPSYPDAREFLKNRAVLGAAIVGTGMMLGACGDSDRLGGVSLPGPSNAKREDWAGDPAAWPGGGKDRERTHVSLPGKPRIEPKQDTPPLPGVPPEPRPVY